jgi:hypothetical protein
MAGDEFEDYKAKTRAGGEAGMEQPKFVVVIVW